MSLERPENHILRTLAESDPSVFAQLSRDLEPFPMHQGSVLGTPRLITEHTYFVASGVVALVASTQAGDSVEVALVGREGAAGITDALGNQPLPYRLVAQLPGLAYRAPKKVIRDHIFSCSSLHELLMDYAQRLTHQLAQSALCNRFHNSVQRLARWLLLTAERADTTSFELTHDFVAQMVGAPRPVVSEAAAALRDKGIIDYRRGVLTIRNSKRLEKVACECFAALSLSPNATRATRAASAAARGARKPKQK